MIIRPKSRDKVSEQFLAYIQGFPISPKTFRNYKSDVTHFLGWLILKMRSYGVFINSLTDSTPFIKNDLAREYKSFLSENNEPSKTINRRLSTLRHLARFFVESQILDFDFMNEVANIYTPKSINLGQHPILNEFEKHLEGQNVSKNTIKNYLSDVRQFLSWVDAQKALMQN